MNVHASVALLLVGVVSGELDLKTGTNVTFVAPVPSPPPLDRQIVVPPHNLTRPTVDYKYAVLVDQEEKIWLKQMHYLHNGKVKVHKNNFTEILEDAEFGWVALRVDTGAAGGGGACVLLPLDTVLVPNQDWRPGTSARRSRARRHVHHASYSLASLRPTGAASADKHETFVQLRGPLIDSATVTGPRVQRLCERIDVYAAEKPAVQGPTRSRALRQAFKTAIKLVGWVWHNRRVLGIPFGVRGGL